MWPIQLALLPFIVRRMFLSSSVLVILNLSRKRPNWTAPSFCSTTFQNLLGISGTFRSAHFQHYTKACFNCSISLFMSSLLVKSVFLLHAAVNYTPWNTTSWTDLKHLYKFIFYVIMKKCFGVFYTAIGRFTSFVCCSKPARNRKLVKRKLISYYFPL
jgi:hypothetical protein